MSRPLIAALADGALALGGVRVPPNAGAVDTLLDTIKRSPRLDAALARLAEAAGNLQTETLDFSGEASATLAQLWYRTVLVRSAAVQAGGAERLVYWLLLRGLAEGFSIPAVVRAALVAVWHLDAAPMIEAAAFARLDQHEAGQAVATVAFPMAGGFDPPDDAMLTAVGDILRRVGRRRRKMVENLGEYVGSEQATLAATVAKAASGKGVLGVIADAMDGHLDRVPASLSRDLADEAEKHRRWYGRGVNAKGRADGEPLLEVVASAEFDGTEQRPGGARQHVAVASGEARSADRPDRMAEEEETTRAIEAAIAADPKLRQTRADALESDDLAYHPDLSLRVWQKRKKALRDAIRQKK